MRISLKGLNKAAVLAALYNNSRTIGMGVFQARSGDMTLETAQELLGGKDSGDYCIPQEKGYFDYLYGRVMKIDLSGDILSTWGYDRDLGEGAVLRVLQEAGMNPEVLEEV